MPRARIELVDGKSILTRTSGYLAGFTHSLQPYAGCQFSCAYCYVRELAVQRTNRFGLPWSRWLLAKRNAPELLARARYEHARIFMSSATDPYTPIERELRITRRCIQVFAERAPRALIVQTRSPLVVRDAEWIARIPRAAVSFTITTCDERVRRLLEPDSPKFSRRVATLRALREAGVRVQVAVSPLLPGDVGELARAISPWADRVVVDDFQRGDGAGGRRSRAALATLAAAGFEAWTRPGYAQDALARLRRELGAERVGESQAGFSELDWLGC